MLSERVWGIPYRMPTTGCTTRVPYFVEKWSKMDVWLNLDTFLSRRLRWQDPNAILTLSHIALSLSSIARAWARTSSSFSIDKCFSPSQLSLSSPLSVSSTTPAISFTVKNALLLADCEGLNHEIGRERFADVKRGNAMVNKDAKGQKMLCRDAYFLLVGPWFVSSQNFKRSLLFEYFKFMPFVDSFDLKDF